MLSPLWKLKKEMVFQRGGIFQYLIDADKLNNTKTEM